MWKSEKAEKTFNTKLFVRILPSTDFHYDSIKTETNKKVLYVRCLQDFSKGSNVKNPNFWYFCTDGVFWNSCQDEVYETVTSGLYDELFDGVRAIIVCYGQTGTGKTFTTSGLRFSYQNRGLILRILAQLFEEEEARRDVSRIRIAMSYLEFTGQKVKDLISNEYLNKEVTEHLIPDEAWAWRQLFLAESRKSCSESAPYKGSNRGHSVVTFYIHSESLVDTDPVIKHSKIHIVDMGGIDNVGNGTSAWRDRLDVGTSNLSKSFIEQLFLCLNKRVTYKNVCPCKSNRFLLYLHDTLKNSCVLRFIAHIYGNFENLPVTISTLRFGERIRALRPTKLERLVQSNRDLQIHNLEKEYFRLKYEVELMGMLKDSPDSSNISQERLQEIKRAAEAFLFNQLEDLTLFSLGQASLTLKVFKDMYQKLSAEKEQMVKDVIATAAEMMQSQLAAERISGSNANVVSSTSQKYKKKRMSRRRSRQVESQTSFGISHRSTDSVPNVGRVLSAVQQAGVTDKKGIGIGPGKTASIFEGNVTKAFKKLRSKKSESVITKGIKSATTKELGIFSSKNQILDEISELSVGQGIPSRDTAWKNFFCEKPELANELSEKVENTEEKAKEAKKNYTRSLAKLAKMREEMEDNKLDLENCEHIRQIYGKAELDEEGNALPKQFEKKLTEALAQKQELLNEAVENCHVALTDFRNAAEELSDAQKSLEDFFQEFCKEHYKTVFASADFVFSVTKSEEEVEEKGMLTDADLNIQARMGLYARLQEQFLNTVLKTPKNKKKEWIKLF